MDKIKFIAIIEKHPDLDAGYIKFPYDVQEMFGVKGQVKVKALFDGTVEYRGSLAKMGFGCHTLGITKEIRNKIKKSFGDTVNVEIEKDTEERIVAIPQDAALLLDNNSKAKEYYESLSYTDRKEYIVWIESAKKAETRNNRLKLFIEKLNNRKKLTDK